MPDQSRDDMLERLHQWGGAQAPARDASAHAFLEAVTRTRHARRRRHATIASVLIVGASLGGWLALRPTPAPPAPMPRVADHQPSNNEPRPNPRPPLDPSSATIFAVMRANDGYAREDIILPAPIALTWAMENPLGS